jgi:2-hydroxymuconate-semialdehyde hydrolase
MDLRQRLEVRPARRLTLEGVDTHVLEAGTGPPLVLLHGGIESAGAYWAPVLPLLAASHRLVVPDVPGLGESAALDGVTQPALSGWFRALLRATCPTPPVLVAHSLLGTFAARFAARNSRSLRHLVLCGAPGVGPYRMPPGLLLAAVLMGIRPSQRSLMRFARWPFHDLARMRQRDPEWFDLFFAYTLECARTPRVQRTMRRLISLYTKQIPLADLRAVTVPATLLWGAHDRMVPVRVGRAAAASVGWPLRVLPDVGHVPNLEDPAGFVATIDDILKGVESGR